MKLIPALAVVGLLAVTPVFAGGLSEKLLAANLDFRWTDVDDGEETTTLFGSCLFGFTTGFFQVGLFVSYFDTEDKFGNSTDGISYGPIVEINFLPDRIVTPFIGAFLGSVEGDVGDVYDLSYGAAVGAKFFVGDSASVNLALSFNTLDSVEGGPEDIDTTALTAGFSIYFGGQ